MITADRLGATIRACVRGESEWPLFIYGKSGTGKTKACEVLLNMAGGWLTTMTELSKQLVAAERGELHVNNCGIGWTVRPAEIWEDLKTWHLLVVDEVGIRQPTDAQYETIKTLLDWRVDRNVKPTILVSNLSPTGLQGGYDDRIVSRMTCGTVFEAAGPDLRLG